MSIEGRVRSLLAGADKRWMHATGVSQYWVDQPQARRLFHANLGESVGHWVSRFEEAPGDQVEILRQSEFSVDRENHSASVNIRSWSGEEPPNLQFTVNLSKELVSGRAHGTKVGAESLALILPAYVACAMDLKVRGERFFADRLCVTVDVTERDRTAEREKFRMDPFGMMPGGREFEILVDPVSGVIVRASKLNDGVEVEFVELSRLVLSS